MCPAATNNKSVIYKLQSERVATKLHLHPIAPPNSPHFEKPAAIAVRDFDLLQQLDPSGKVMFYKIGARKHLWFVKTSRGCCRDEPGLCPESGKSRHGHCDSCVLPLNTSSLC